MARKPVLGYRNHYLRFRVPDTWEFLSQAGFKYDSTLGYADCIGFRNGMCHPFRPFNLNTGHEIDIVEIPLVVMDGTLFQSYMRLDSDSAIKLVKRLIDQVAELHGVFTLLWHNTFLLQNSDGLEFYHEILRYCNERNAWLSNGFKIAQFWKDFVLA